MAPLVAAVGGGPWLRRVAAWIVAVTFGSLTMASVATLLLWDAMPGLFPARAHLLLGSMPLVLIAISSLVFLAARRPGTLDMVKGLVLAAAFLFWAANQLLPNTLEATLFNDLAIALFVLDVFLSIVGWATVLATESAQHALPDRESHPANGRHDVSHTDEDFSQAGAGRLG